MALRKNDTHTSRSVNNSFLLARVYALYSGREHYMNSCSCSICCRGFFIPLWAMLPPLQVVLSSACSVFPSHCLPGHSQSIHMVHVTHRSPRHSISHIPTWGTERCAPPGGN